MRSVPIYTRLPRGPHGLDRRAVLLNQRARLHGAMIEAVAAGGYESTSVREVIALAGVSRRAFYEQFENREDCLLQTFDAIAAHALACARESYLAAPGRRSQRVGEALAALAREAGRKPSAATLAAVGIEGCGLAAVARRRRAAVGAERPLALALWGEGPPAPVPIVRGIVGGLLAILRVHLDRAADVPPGGLGEELARWVRHFEQPVTPSLAARLSDRAGAILSRRAGAPARHPSPAGASAGAPAGGVAADVERAAIVHALLRVAALGDYRDLTPARIADEAGVSVESFQAAFTDRDDCLAAAIADLRERLASSCAPEPRRAAAWASLARRRLGDLLDHLAAHPLDAHTIARGAFAAGRRGASCNNELSSEMAARLLDGAPLQHGPLLADAVGGALWHVIGCQVAGGRLALLPALGDYLAYLTITPVLGSEQAAALLRGEDRGPQPPQEPASAACG